MTKQADYGIVLMTYFAQDGARGEARGVQNARDLAQRARLPQPTVTKILKTLARDGLLVSQRGIKGGYQLARAAEQISVAQILSALEGPIAITQCCEHGPGCEQEDYCPVRGNWQLIDVAVRAALEGISLAEIARPLPGQRAGALREAIVSGFGGAPAMPLNLRNAPANACRRAEGEGSASNAPTTE